MRKSPKKWGILILAVVVAIVCSILIIIAMKFDHVNNEIVKNNQLELITVNLDWVKEKIESKESFLIIITNEECTYCDELYEILNEYEPNQKVTIYDLSFKDFSYDREEVKDVFPSFVGTPNILYVEDGTIISQYDNMEGNLTIDLFGRWIEKYYK